MVAEWIMALLLKLAFLGIRAGTKVISKKVKKSAAENPRFKAICTSTARSYHNLVTKSNVRILPNVKIKRSKPLSDAEATELGADMIAELMVWGAATAQVLGVYYCQSVEKEEKAQRLNDKFIDIQANYDEMKVRFERTEKEISFIRSFLSVRSLDDAPDETESLNLA